MKKLIAYMLLFSMVDLSYAQGKIPQSHDEVDPYNVTVNASENERPTCQNNSHFKGDTPIITSEVEDTSNEKEFYDVTPLKTLSGIKSVYLSGSTLTLTLVDKGYFEQFRSPVLQTVQETHYNAEPGSAIFVSLILATLPLIFDPKDTINWMVGCSDYEIVSKKLDLSRKETTDKFEWKDIQKKHTILIAGFDKDYRFYVDNEGNNNTIDIDLTSAIKSAALTGTSYLKINCVDCSLPNENEKVIVSGLKSDMDLNKDFRPIKDQLILEEKLRVAEKIKVEKAEIVEQMRLEKIAESELRQAKLAEQLRVAEQKRLDDEAEKVKAVAAEAETAREKERTRCLYDTDIGVCSGGNFSNGSDQLMYAERLGFGGMLNSKSLDQVGKNIIQLRVRNNTPSDVKDITFTCDSVATSGTILDSEDLTLFQIFPKDVALDLTLKIREV
jgi:hypothetical protein